ncbi:MAG: sigma factor-like helix-turn-helix DNA-binding protein [Candidatus Thermoplasmatota archaeon]|nr:sigma factor-like helix-turn-helix DNA-binding protein [Candidatus Thermoplasmatota archaeon]
MATPEQVSKIVKLRALGWSQAEIAAEVGLSRQAVAYQLKRLKSESKKQDVDDLFAGVILGGMVGAASGLLIGMLLEQLKKGK